VLTNSCLDTRSRLDGNHQPTPPNLFRRELRIPRALYWFHGVNYEATDRSRQGIHPWWETEPSGSPLVPRSRTQRPLGMPPGCGWLFVAGCRISHEYNRCQLLALPARYAIIAHLWIRHYFVPALAVYISMSGYIRYPKTHVTNDFIYIVMWVHALHS
jgi:hypothetical protein